MRRITSSPNPQNGSVSLYDSETADSTLAAERQGRAERRRGQRVDRGGRRGDADIRPRLLQSSDVGAEAEDLSRLDSVMGKLSEARLRAGRGKCRVPDLAGDVPGVSADRDGEQGERTIRDARIVVHAAVVAPGRDVVLHVARLRVLADGRVVVRGARVDHAAQRDAVDGGLPDAVADEPVALSGRQTLHAHLDHLTEHVGHVLVQRAGLAVVLEVRNELGHAVRDLVAANVEQHEGRERAAQARTTVGHLGAVPERVLVATAVVDRGDELHAVGIDAVAAVHFTIEFANRAGEVEREIDFLVAGRRIELEARLVAGMGLSRLGVVDLARGIRAGADEATKGVLAKSRRGEELLRHLEGVEEARVIGIGLRQALEDVVGDDALEGATIYDSHRASPFCGGKFRVERWTGVPQSDTLETRNIRQRRHHKWVPLQSAEHFHNQTQRNIRRAVQTAKPISKVEIRFSEWVLGGWVLLGWKGK